MENRGEDLVKEHEYRFSIKRGPHWSLYVIEDVRWQREDSAAVNAEGWIYSPYVTGDKNKRDTRGSVALENMVGF